MSKKSILVKKSIKTDSVKRDVEELLSKHSLVKLNIGCGTDYKDGWINIDNNTDNNIEKLDLDWDLRYPLPFPENSVDYIFNEHFQEHLTVEEGIAANKDFLRVLKPGGVLRIATPDLDKIVYNYENTPLNEDPVIQQFGFKFVQTKAEWINMSFSSWGHKWVYNFEELGRRLREAGYTDVRRCVLQESEHEDLRNIETRSGISLIVEATKKANITIGILTYNHEKYIEKCLNSVISQAGNFNLQVIVVNDKSNDKSNEIIKKFISKNKNINIKYIVNKNNLGAQKSIYKILGLIKESSPDYWSYIEGDDVYLSSDRTQKHMDMLSSHKSALVSYNKLRLIDENGQLIMDHEPNYLNTVLTTSQLAAQNHIGSFCATFYSVRAFDYFKPDELAGLTVYDWFFNIWLSQFGEIRQIGEYLSGYRQHTTSVWSSKSQADQCWELIRSIDSYNQKLDYKYDKSFQSYKRNLINQLASIKTPMCVDITLMSNSFLVDDHNYFTDELIKYILTSNEQSAAVLTASKSKKLIDTVQEYKRNNKNIADRILGYDGMYNIKAKCIYATSIEDAYRALSIVNTSSTLLVFEIPNYDESKLKSDKHLLKKLQSVSHSDRFVKVIVHSNHLKQYLIDKKICSDERITTIPDRIYMKNSSAMEQREKDFMIIREILNKCLEGSLRPVPTNILKTAKRMYLRYTINLRSIIIHKLNRHAVISKTKSTIKRNKTIYRIAKSLYVPARSIYRSKVIK